MADYREISQGYAQGAIRAVVLINSGAAIALLSQISSLLPEVGARVIGIAFICFVVGVACGVTSWVCGFDNARSVDLTERGQLSNYSIADRWQCIGVCVLAFGLILFLVGCLSLAWEFLDAGVVSGEKIS
ncbi:hypothetical protein [Pseudophaeobacter leonis]|uniref:hypothetical protein n=1 Tax=Pseudophaeobacter leonis TaxID=1144477 RepID=UPI00111C4FBE|nr:hypothetical protein [Pseudophaeobacter leonis]